MFMIFKLDTPISVLAYNGKWYYAVDPNSIKIYKSLGYAKRVAKKNHASVVCLPIGSSINQALQASRETDCEDNPGRFRNEKLDLNDYVVH